MSFTEEQRAEILSNTLRDPVAFLQTFLTEHFYLPVPWIHRGLISILSERTDFLLRYGQLRKIVENFVHKRGENEPRQIFHVVDSSGRELTPEEIIKLDETIAQKERILSWEEVDSLGVRILLDVGPFTLLMMPRGSSKTTIAGFGMVIYSICFQLIRFQLYVSKAGPHSQGQVESVKRELATNPAIIEFFGSLKPQRADEERWSNEKIETVTGIALQYRGKGSAIRGVNHNNRRPDEILVDDPQNKDDVRSELVKVEDKRWAFAELTPARERIRGGKLKVLGTYLGKNSLVGIWSNDPRFTTVNIGVKDKDGEFVWPHYMDQKKYDEERISFQLAGLLGDFYREYHNQDFADEKQIFKEDFFIYDPVTSDCVIFATYGDPATSEKRTADFFCICTLGITNKGIIKIVDMWLKRGASEEEKMDEYFRQSIQWDSVLHGFESNAYQAVFGAQLRAEMFRRQRYFEVTPVMHKTRKIDRIQGALRPRYAAGYVRHRLKFPEYEAQLLEFRKDGSHDHDDGPDAAAACLVLMDPTAAFNAGEDPADTHEKPIEEVLGTECMNWAS